MYIQLKTDDVEECSLNDGNNISIPVFVILSSSKNNPVINTFKFYQDMISKFHKIGKFFSKSSKNSDNLNPIKKKLSETAPDNKMTINISITQIAEERVLLHD